MSMKTAITIALIGFIIFGFIFLNKRKKKN